MKKKKTDIQKTDAGEWSGQKAAVHKKIRRWRGNVRFRKMALAAIGFVLALCICGCREGSPKETVVPETRTMVPAVRGEYREDGESPEANFFQSCSDEAADRAREEEKITALCIDLYTQAEAENKLADPETIRGVVNRFGENGYPAVDSKNQVNMTEAEQVVEFCRMVEERKKAALTMVEVTYLGGFVKYDLRTENGTVDVVRSFYQYENGTMERKTTGRYQAEGWKYTEEGYLMFSGVWYLDALYVLTLSGVEEYTALRVRPLDESYRELTRKYLTPVGFERNNMFIVDWSETDFGALNFYDLYDIFYREVNGDYVSYVVDETMGTGGVYRIPKDEFETVIMTYFNIDSKTLQSKTVYHGEDKTYEYRPRGCDEAEYPEHPYSEVVGATENGDGTITLLANVVFPYEGSAKLYSHEVVVRLLEDGTVQYVSNRIIPAGDCFEATWHAHRFTAEEWNGLYGGK